MKLIYICCLQKEKKEKKKSETEIEVDGTKELHVTLSPRTPAGDPPETEELIKALMVNFINYTSNNHDAEFVSLAIKYFIHMEIYVESMRHISRRFDNSDTSTLSILSVLFGCVRRFFFGRSK